MRKRVAVITDSDIDVTGLGEFLRARGYDPTSILPEKAPDAILEISSLVLFDADPVNLHINASLFLLGAAWGYHKPILAYTFEIPHTPKIIPSSFVMHAVTGYCDGAAALGDALGIIWPALGEDLNEKSAEAAGEVIRKYKMPYLTKRGETPHD